jgi:hypothetical protein
MVLQTPRIESRFINGEPVHVGQVTVTPQSRTLVVRLPWGGFVWHRPVAILVERDGQISRRSIVDVTRLAELGLLALGVLSLLLSFRHKETDDEQ